ncbi:hypothetical protein D3C81_2055850 [compost metagenome]
MADHSAEKVLDRMDPQRVVSFRADQGVGRQVVERTLGHGAVLLFNHAGAQQRGQALGQIMVHGAFVWRCRFTGIEQHNTGPAGFGTGHK